MNTHTARTPPVVVTRPTRQAWQIGKPIGFAGSAAPSHVVKRQKQTWSVGSAVRTIERSSTTARTPLVVLERQPRPTLQIGKPIGPAPQCAVMSCDETAETNVVRTADPTRLPGQAWQIGNPIGPTRQCAAISRGDTGRTKRGPHSGPYSAPPPRGHRWSSSNVNHGRHGRSETRSDWHGSAPRAHVVKRQKQTWSAQRTLLGCADRPVNTHTARTTPVVVTR